MDHPHICQFAAYIGHAIERNYRQCRLDYGHTGGHLSGTWVLSEAQAIRTADGRDLPLPCTRINNFIVNF